MHISRLLWQATDKLVTTAAEQSDLSVGVAAGAGPLLTPVEAT